MGILCIYLQILYCNSTQLTGAMAENFHPADLLERCAIHPPPQSAPEMTLPLLYFDIPWLYFHPVHRLLFFDFPCSKSHFQEVMVPAMKQSLGQTLSHFLPLAGNIVHPLNTGMPFSRFVAGDTVSLTIAECDYDFERLTGNQPRVSDEFYACVPHLPAAKHFSDNVVFPVLALQITLFPDHGVCLGFTNHHAIADASSVVRFIKSWAAVNRHGGDAKLIQETTMLPFYDRSALADPDGLGSHYWNLMKRSSVVESPLLDFPLHKHRATFVLSKDEVQKLKNYVQKKRSNIRATAFTTVCAVVWVCLARAETDVVADDETEYFTFPADCRGRLKPPLPEQYFGNCLALVKAEATHGILKGGDGFLVAAESIAEAIQKTVYNEKGILDGAENWPLEFVKMMGKRLFGVAGSPRFDLYEVDYGWGRPKKFESPSIDGEASMSLCKSRDLEGGFEIGLSRPRQRLDSFAAVFAQLLNDM